MTSPAIERLHELSAKAAREINREIANNTANYDFLADEEIAAIIFSALNEAMGPMREWIMDKATHADGCLFPLPRRTAGSSWKQYQCTCGLETMRESLPPRAVSK